MVLLTLLPGKVIIIAEFTMILLEVLSWEERARILTKVWIAGIALALFSVTWFIWIQRKKKKKYQQLHARRGMTPKQKTHETLKYTLQLLTEVPEAIQKKLKIKHKHLINGAVNCCYSTRNGDSLAALAISQETDTKVYIHSYFLNQENDQRALHWLLRQLVNDLRGQQLDSVTYRVQQKENDNTLDMLESFGFKRVAVSKKERGEFKYALKLFI